MLSARAERAYNKGALRSLPFFLYALPSSNFHFPGETTRPSLSLSSRPILPSRSLARSYADAWFSFSLRDHRCFTLNSLPSPPSTPFLTVVLSSSRGRRSEPLRLHAGQKRTLVQRVTNTRFFRFFFRTKISTFWGETRAHVPG